VTSPLEFKCTSCDTPTSVDLLKGDACPACYRDPATNNCADCGKHQESISDEYVCDDCIKRGLHIVNSTGANRDFSGDPPSGE